MRRATDCGPRLPTATIASPITAAIAAMQATSGSTSSASQNAKSSSRQASSSSSTVFEAAQTAHSASTMPALRGVTPAKTRRGQAAGGRGNSARDESASIASRPSASRTAGQRARDSAGGPASSSGASRSRDFLLPWVTGQSSLGPCAARRQCPPTNGAPGRHEGAGPAANADARRGSVPPRRGDRGPSAVPPESAVERRDAWSCRVRPIFTSATSR